MGELLNLELEQKASAVRERLAAAVQEYGRVIYSSSLGAESVVLTDIIWTHFPAIDIFTIDTGRLPEETYELIGKVQARYKRNLRVVYPDAKALETLVSAQGINGFYNSLEARTACCRVRKVEPFKRAIAGYGAWVTGLRHEQSATRAQATAGGMGCRQRSPQGQPDPRLDGRADLAVHPHPKAAVQFTP